jgi:iron complex outermembrane receptor protein
MQLAVVGSAEAIGIAKFGAIVSNRVRRIRLVEMNDPVHAKSCRAALIAAVGCYVIFGANAFAQETAPSGVAEVERVIVTGSNIPTAAEVGPNPVDTYRPSDIEKLGIRNATDLMTQLPQEMGLSLNQNISNLASGGGDGSVILNLRGLLPKETLVLIDGKRAAIVGGGGAGGPGTAGVDINLIPFPMIDHIDILKDGASAVYGSDAVAGVINIFLIHKFRGLEIGGGVGNTNMGASNDARELEAWIKAGVGDDKTDILVIADFYDRAAIYSRDRFLSSNANALAWGGFDNRSSNEPGRVGSFRLIPRLFFSTNSPPPHSAPNVATSPYYIRPSALGVGPGTGNPDGDFVAYNFAALTPAIPSADRQSFYGSFTRDICDKYLVVFADFKYTRSFFDGALAATPFVPDAFKQPSGLEFSPTGISVPLQNPFNPFTVADATLDINGIPVPMTTGVRFRAVKDQVVRTAKITFRDILFDAGLRGELGEFGDYFKNWNWEAGFRYSRNLEEGFGGGVSRSGLRAALLDTDPATAFNPFLGFFGRNNNAAISKVYVTLHGTGEFELPLSYFTVNGDLFNLPAGPVSFAVGLEYRGERWRSDPASESTTFDTIGGIDLEASRVNRDVWSIYQEVRFPITSPTWKFPGAYSLEFDIAEREEWYSQNTSATTVLKAQHSQYDMQKPKFSVRWQPLDPKWIGTLTLRASYTEAFHAATLPDLTPAGAEFFETFPDELHDPRGLTPPGTGVPVIVTGNPNLKPEVAYEWSYGAVYSPKWIKGLTLSADFWHIDLRSIASFVSPQFIIDFENSFPGLVTRDPTTGAITEIVNPSLNLTRAIVEGVDYEAIYILDSAMFGHGDFGRLTLTLNGTYLSRFEFQPTPVSKRIGLSGEFVPPNVAFSGSLPHTRAFVSAFYDGPADTWLGGFDVGATVHYTGQYEDDNIDLTGSLKPQEPRSGPLLPSGNLAQFPEQGARKVREWVTLDLIASYTFNLPPPSATEVPGSAKDGGKTAKIDGKEKNVLPVSTAEYNPCGSRAWLNGTTITIGMQNVFDSDPPFVAGAFENNYDESLATIKGRFWFIQLKKRF